MPTTRLYQAVLRDPGPTLAKRLRRAFSTWLAGLGFPDIPISPHYAATSGGVRARMDALRGCGRFTLEDGRLRTRVTYAQTVERMTGWVVVTVEQYAGEPTEAFAPGFLPAYLATERITDGGVQLPAQAEEHDEDGTVYLLADLAERNRRVPVVVVAVEGRGSASGRANAEYLAERVAGVAQVVWLADLRAQDRFNDCVGGDLAVYGGGIRTYLAGFKPVEEEADRHRVMGGKMVRAEGPPALDRAAGYIIGETAGMKLPDELREPYRVVGRIVQGDAEPEALHEAARPQPVRSAFIDHELYRKMMDLAKASAVRAPVPAPPKSRPPVPAPRAPEPEPEPEPGPAEPPPGVDLDVLARGVADRVADRLAGLADTVAQTVSGRLHGELESMLDLVTSDPQELARHMRTMNSHVESLTRELSEARAGRERADSGRAEAESESSRLEDEIERLVAQQRWLEQDLAEATARERRLAVRVRRLETELAKAAGPVEIADETPESPASLVDALHFAESLTHVVIGETMHEAGLLDLAHPTLRRVWAGKAWDALCALDEYARARSAGGFQGGFRDWCLAETGGRRVISANLLAMKESDSVTGRDKFSAVRTFAVPPEVDPSGRVFMPAHIKLRKAGTPAPRIHFLDDAGGTTGRIWVGYVGDHLPNTRTN
ncbi:hypothetical protein LO762_06265 [Actinocorallia sp. API 0066]|uniref:hypothetical protein n=1 Tax=Actinocorallia sp. API 0066 TaxID=2896846 RepID=UPI001E36704F|nr:hypothetical protein [Actinocorallia sp. API 0066]MCD0448799.1 hypothetical protein [Actinocorallia sp. API 0066]